MMDFKNKTKYGYRKKPVVVQACQYNGPDSIEELKEWVQSNGKTWDENFIQIPQFEQYDFVKAQDVLELFINTLEGRMHASVGDYIIQGVQGEYYACKPNIFHQTYERA